MPCVTPFLESKDRVCFLSCFLLFLQQHWSSGSRAASRAEGQWLMVGQDRGAPRLMGTKVGPLWLSLASLSVKVSRADCVLQSCGRKDDDWSQNDDVLTCWDWWDCEDGGFTHWDTVSSQLHGKTSPTTKCTRRLCCHLQDFYYVIMLILARRSFPCVNHRLVELISQNQQTASVIIDR